METPSYTTGNDEFLTQTVYVTYRWRIDKKKKNIFREENVPYGFYILVYKYIEQIFKYVNYSTIIIVFRCY